MSESIGSLPELNDFYFFYFRFIHKKVQIKVHKKKSFSPVGTIPARENAVPYMDRCKKKAKARFRGILAIPYLYIMYLSI